MMHGHRNLKHTKYSFKLVSPKPIPVFYRKNLLVHRFSNTHIHYASVFIRIKFFFAFFCCATAQIGPRLPHFEVYILHTIKHTYLIGSYKQVYSLSQRPLSTQHATNTRDEHPCHQQDLNPPSQQLCSCRPKYQTTQPQASTYFTFTYNIYVLFVFNIFEKITYISICNMPQTLFFILPFCPSRLLSVTV